MKAYGTLRAPTRTGNPTGGGNLVANPQFDNGLTGWTSATGTATVVADSTNTGGPGANAASLIVAVLSADIRQSINVVGGATYTASFYAVRTAGIGTVYINVNWFDGTNAQVGSGSSTSVTFVAGAYARGITTWVVPATATYGKVVINNSATNAAAGDAYLIKGVQLERGNVATDYTPYPDGYLGQLYYDSTRDTPIVRAAAGWKALANTDAVTNMVTTDTTQTITGAKTFAAALAAANTTITSIATGSIGLVVAGIASQSADLQRWLNSGGSVLGSISPTGNFYCSGTMHSGGQVQIGTNSNLQLQLTGGAIDHALEVGRQDGVASSPFIDFHSGATAVDYDVRVQASGGTGSAGAGMLTITAATMTVSASTLFNGNATMRSGSLLYLNDTTNAASASLTCDVNSQLIASGNVSIFQSASTGGLRLGSTAANGAELKLNATASSTHWSVANQAGIFTVGLTSGGLGLGSTLSGRLTLSTAGDLLVSASLSGTFLKPTRRAWLKTASENYSNYRYMTLGGSDTAWYNVCSVVCNANTFSGAAFEVELRHNNSNYVGWAARHRFTATITRSASVVDDTDSATIYGTSTDYVRIVKIDNANWELQVRQPASFNFDHFDIRVTASSATINWQEPPVLGTTTGTIYTPTRSTMTTLFAVADAGQVVVNTSSAGYVPVIVNGFTGSTADLQDWRNGGVLARVDSAGSLYAGGGVASPWTDRSVVLTGGGGNHSVDVGRRDGTTSTPVVNFHSAGTTTTDVQISASGGTGIPGAGTMLVSAATVATSGVAAIGGNGATNTSIVLVGGAADHSIDIGRRDATISAPVLNFHSNGSAVNDVSVAVTGGTGVSGGGSATLTANGGINLVTTGTVNVAGGSLKQGGVQVFLSNRVAFGVASMSMLAGNNTAGPSASIAHGLGAVPASIQLTGVSNNGNVVAGIYDSDATNFRFSIQRTDGGLQSSTGTYTVHWLAIV